MGAIGGIEVLLMRKLYWGALLHEKVEYQQTYQNFETFMSAKRAKEDVSPAA